MTTKQRAISLVRELHPDSIGTRKNGNVLCRWGYFYRHGRTTEHYVNTVQRALDTAGIPAIIVDSGDHWAAFRGGASLANQSHFFVEFKVVD